MARSRALSAREVDALRDVGMHWVSDNLYIQIREQGTRSWLFRYWVDGKPKVIRSCRREEGGEGAEEGRAIRW